MTKLKTMVKIPISDVPLDLNLVEDTVDDKDQDNGEDCLAKGEDSDVPFRLESG